MIVTGKVILERVVVGDIYGYVDAVVEAARRYGAAEGIFNGRKIEAVKASKPAEIIRKYFAETS